LAWDRGFAPPPKRAGRPRADSSRGAPLPPADRAVGAPRRAWSTVLTLAVAGLGWGSAGGAASAVSVSVPNGSFESPQTLFVDTNLDAWERTERPADYDESGGFLWSQLTGVFRNPAATAADHLENCDGSQAVWLFAVPGAGIFQDYESRDWNDAQPTHAFDVRFEEGKSYTLTVGVLGGGGGMVPEATLDLSLYYRGEGTNRIRVATTRVSNDLSQPRNRFADYQVRVPVVRTSDPWVGRSLGIELLSTVTEAEAGGYWDLDHVRLETAGAPKLEEVALTAEGLTFLVQGESGAVFEVLAAADPTRPLSEWKAVGSITNAGAGARYVASTTNAVMQFFRAVQAP
jgi:hypothetical protein